MDERLASEALGEPLSNDACEEGTVGGGQIEIYANKKDAEKRNDYLSGFDGTPLADAHTIKGKAIIRISHNLTLSTKFAYKRY